MNVPEGQRNEGRRLGKKQRRMDGGGKEGRTEGRRKEGSRQRRGGASSWSPSVLQEHTPRCTHTHTHTRHLMCPLHQPGPAGV